MKTCEKHIEAIVNSELCTGCGICEGVCPKDVFEVQDSKVVCVDEEACINCGLCEKCCPSYGYKLNNLYKNFYKVYEAASKVDEVRENATSGGVVTQLLCEALDSKAVDCVAIVTGCETLEEGYCKYFLTDKREDILSAAGSNYVQASMGQLMKKLKECDKRVALVALPCQMYGISQAMKYIPSLKKNIVLKIGFFCGYTYDYDCIRGLSAAANACVHDIKRVIGWREDGLPGNFAFEKKDGEIKKIPFIDEHSIDVTFYAHEKCMLCKDCFSDYADIVTGDIGRNWEDKKTLVFTRTKAGVYWFEKLSQNIFFQELSPQNWKDTPIAFMELEKRGKVSERIITKQKRGEKVPVWSGDYNERELLVTKKIFTRWVQKKQNRIRKSREQYEQKPQEMLRLGRALYYQRESSFLVKYLCLAERAIQVVFSINWLSLAKNKIGHKEKRYSAQKDCINVAVVGLGSWGSQYISLLQQHKGFHIISIYDRNEQECKRIAEKYKLKKQLPQDMVKNEEIDTIFVLTPNHLHYDLIMDAFAHGKNVFVEKPLVNEYAAAELLYNEAKKRKCSLYVGHSMKVSRGFFTLKEMIKEGKLGEIKHFSCIRALHGMNENIRVSWRSDTQLAPLLPMIQLGIHLIDASLYLFGDLCCVNASVQELCGLTESVACTLSTGNITGSLMTCYDTVNTMEYVVYGSKAKAILNEKELVLVYDKKRRVIERGLEKENLLKNELDDYYNMRKQADYKPINTSERAVKTIKIFEDIRRMVQSEENV